MIRSLTLVAALGFLAMPSLGSQIVSTLHSFPAPGANPRAALVQGSDGNFYGTTDVGGSEGNGTVFKITPAGTATILYSFATHPNDGANPRAALVQGSDGSFYGTTLNGGSKNLGTVFKITPSGTETVLYSFGTNPNDGGNPQAALVQGPDGNFYGTAPSGNNQNAGTVFAITPSGTETVLGRFATPATSWPEGGLTLGSDGSFYGTTQYGGNGGGTVFKMTLSGTLTVLYKFGTNPNDGSGPAGTLTPSGNDDGSFFGTTQSGGSQQKGTVFKITPSGTETVLYSFGTNPNDGFQPQQGLVRGADGNFYGTTIFGGNDGGGQGYGTVFKITPAGTEAVLCSFGINAKDGSYPKGLTQGSDGKLYGTTETGGSFNTGTVFTITPAGTESVLYSFGTNDGSLPLAGLALGRDGNFYGTTYYGGSHSAGTVFEVTPRGKEAVLYSFGTNASDGSGPAAGLTLGSDGNFYGTTELGGSGSDGTFFKITPAGRETLIDTFGVNSNGAGNVTAPLVRGNDGNFYGTTYGTIFEITPSGTVSLLHQYFDGTTVRAGLIVGRDGNFYGTTYQGGYNNQGNVFEITPSGTESVLYSFGANPKDGAGASAGLVEDGNGNFYGTTYYGGSLGNGTVFKVAPSGTETVLYSFGTNPSDGIHPQAALVEDLDGNFYGTTTLGGSENKGTIFEITPSGTETVLYSFGADPNDGANPQSALLIGSHGDLYGTAGRGGSLGGGAVFEVNLSAPPVAADDQVVLTDASPVTIDVLGNDSEPYGRPLTVTAITRPAYGAAQINSDGSITYTPRRSFAGFSGTDHFKYTISNGFATATAEVTISNPYARNPPVATDDQIVLIDASPVTIDVLENDSDPSGRPLTVIAMTRPGFGAAQINGDGSITYTPRRSFAGFSGTDHFKYTISNGFATATATVAILNPYEILKGNFTAIFAGPGENGLITFSLANAGSFTGTLRLGNKAFSFKGAFGADGTAQIAINNQTLTIQVDLESAILTNRPAQYTLSGTYGGIAFSANHALYRLPAPQAPQAGYYTVLLPATAPSSAMVPSGTGYATLTVTKSGSATLAGLLADGTPFTSGSFLTGGGSDGGAQLPVYTSLPYVDAGALSGALTFNSAPGVSDCQAALAWQKPAQMAGIYPAGFATTLTAIGSHYTRPRPGKLALDLPLTRPNATLTFSEPDFTNALVQSVTVTLGIGGNDRIESRALAMTIDASTGLFTGTFLDPASNETTKVRGALLLEQNIGGGFFSSPNQSGAVSLISN